MRTKAIIIKRTPTNEYDQIVTLYSEDFGTMRAMAKGICRPRSVQSMHLDAFNLVEFEVVHGKALPIIASAHVVNSFPVLKNSLQRIAIANFFTEVIDKISFENEKDHKLWEFLNMLLADLNDAPDNELLARFRKQQAEFIHVLGYAPQVSRCVICSCDMTVGPEKMLALSPELGGVLCGDCFLSSGRGILFNKNDLGMLTGDALSASANCSATEIPQPGPNEVGDPAGRGTFSALDSFFEYTVGKKLSSLVFLYQALSVPRPVNLIR